VDELSMSRFESLAAQDYHLGTLWIPPPPPGKDPKMANNEKGALEGLWDAAGGKYASRIFSSSASVLSRSSGGDDKTASIASPPGSTLGVAASSITRPKRRLDAHPYIVEPGLKLFIMSPYDCVLAIKRAPGDRLEWLLERKAYEEAWHLLDSHPDTIPADREDQTDSSMSVASPSSDKGHGSLADFFSEDAPGIAADERVSEASQREKRRIGDLWIRKLVDASKWSEAGDVCAKVLGASGRRWEHWVWTFAQADRFDDITPHVPTTDVARLPSVVYELILGHYVQADPERLRRLLDDWDPREELYDVGSVTKAIESRLDTANSDDGSAIREGSEEWKTLTDCIARLYLAGARAREALRCWITVQNADAAFKLIREEKLMDVVAAEDVLGLVMLRVNKETMDRGSLKDLSEASEEAIGLLVEEALRGTVPTSIVIDQLKSKGPRFRPFIYFYLKALWNSSSKHPSADVARQYRPRGKATLHVDDGHALVEDHADLAVELFAQYDRDLLLTLLKASSIYSYEKAAAICEQQHYIPELVHILSKTGQTKRALFLIIGELGDVKQAIDFAKNNSSKDGELWNDLLDYGMDKPAFIRGLLEEVGTAIDPIKLVQRIPEGLEIEGLREGVSKMMREYDIQFSISEGVAKVLSGEVATGMDTLRAGRKKAVRFEVRHENLPPDDVKLKVVDPPTDVPGGEALEVPKRKAEKAEVNNVQPGCCVGCGEVFHEEGELSSNKIPYEQHH
jgi:vacuolar protein sorting-associated protein 41